MNDMKLIMENFRKNVLENETSGCVTVGEVLSQIDAAQKQEKDAEDVQRLKGWGVEFTKKAVNFIPLVGPWLASSWDAKDVLTKAKKEMQTQSIHHETVEEFPVLGKLSIDPELIKVVDNDLLKHFDEEYEEYLAEEVNTETCVDHFKGINEFIRSRIKDLTDRHVVIRDESGTYIKQ